MIERKIVSRLKLVDMLKSIRKNKSIVFTNGCFDILHKGHVKYLECAKKLGDILIVGINSDLSVRKLKGPHRPINKVSDRAYILSALESVDFVTIFNELTPEATIRLLKPDVLVKGSDWNIEKIVGRDFVESYGGKVKRINFLKGYSTTSFLNKINPSVLR